MAARDKTVLETLDPGLRAAAYSMRLLGITSLAIICIGLITAWAGLLGKVRWAWLVLLIIVGLWAFPVLVLPILQGRIVVTWKQWLSLAIREPGEARIWTESFFIFLLMVVALILPVRALFHIKERGDE
ncbi:MAG TPA: hypothetical protein VGS27_02635 [Candidatus Sulfotelmatobacter sp.]|nr:hypothetical protein [Candidatus Sulfotelmatobacter sp.]